MREPNRTKLVENLNAKRKITRTKHLPIGGSKPPAETTTNQLNSKATDKSKLKFTFQDFS